MPSISQSVAPRDARWDGFGDVRAPEQIKGSIKERDDLFRVDVWARVCRRSRETAQMALLGEEMQSKAPGQWT